MQFVKLVGQVEECLLDPNIVLGGAFEILHLQGGCKVQAKLGRYGSDQQELSIIRVDQ